MAWTIVAHIGAMSTDGASVTTPAIDTRNSDLIVLGCTTAAGTAAAPTDSASNTWTQIQQTNNGSGVRGTLLYKAQPAVSQTHTFTLSPGANNFPCICVLAVSGSKTTPLDQNNATASVAGGSKQPGSITPTQAGELIVSYETTGGLSITFSIDSGFTISDQNPGANLASFCNAMAYLAQGAAAPINPTWTITGSPNSNNACLIASFLQLVTGGFDIHRLYA